MKTLIIKPKKNSDLRLAAETLKRGGLVAFPTETVYGLGANALDGKAVEKIFEAKGRPNDNPLIVHVSDKEELFALVSKVPEKAQKLMDKFWPGPLTLVLNKSKSVPRAVTAGQETVAIRMPNNKIALELIKQSGIPVAAPSANVSTRPSPTEAKHVLEDLDGKIDAIIDGGRTDIGLESTVIDLTSETPTILRPGKITKEELEKVIGKIEIKTKAGKVAKAPGMKYKHYSPKARVILVRKKEIPSLKRKLGTKKTGIILKEGTFEEFAKSLFSKFREMDKRGIEVILVEKIKEKGLGVAIMNRLKKAAGEI